MSKFLSLHVQSSMQLPINDSGHVFWTQTPCSVIGRYNEFTGTVVVETVICNGRHYDMLEINSEDWAKFHDELKACVLNLEF